MRRDKNQEKVSELEFDLRYKTIIADIQISKPTGYQVMSLFYFRRCVYTAIIILLSRTPLSCLILVIIMGLVSFFYVIIFRPYETILSKINSTQNELYFVASVIVISTLLFVTLGRKELVIFGYVLIGIVIMCVIVNWVAIISFGVYMFKYKKKKFAYNKKNHFK